MTRTLQLLAAVVAGAAGLWALAWPEEVVRYERVEVPVERIIEREPDTIVRWVERIRVVTPDPVQIAVAVGGGAPEVARFCRPAVLDAVSDTVTAAPDPQLLLRSVVHDPGWFFARDRLLLTGPTSYGDLVAADYLVRPGFSARTVGDSVVVRYPRAALLREVAEPAVWITLGIGLARLLW